MSTDLKTLTPGTAAASSVVVGAASTASASPSLFTTTGSGNVVLSTSPTLVTPALGTPSALTLTNATGLPVSTGLSGAGTGVLTALGNATNAASGLVALDANQSLSITGATVTTSQPVLNLSQTWNAGAVTFTGLKFNATDTASAAGSLLLDLQTGSSSRISVAKDGVTTINGVAASFLNTLNVRNTIGGTNILNFTFGSNGTRFALGTTTNHNMALFTNNGVDSLTVTTAGAIQFRSTALVAWTSTDDASGTRDTILARDAANTLALRNGATAQTYRIYNTYTDASNNEYLTLDWSTTANTATIATVANGSGTIRALALKSATGTVGFSASSISLDTSRQIRWATSPITYIVPRTANDINFGLDAASPLACTIGGCGARSSVDTDTAGANFIVRGGLGTGTGNGGNLQFAVGLPGSTGNATNATVNIAYFAGASGHLLWNTDNTYDIGASGANRPRYVRAGSAIVTPSTTVASLPSASTAGAGARSFVTDANATTFLSTVAGGGANKVPVVSDGTNWLIG